jgi:hypothetical protein
MPKLPPMYLFGLSKVDPQRVQMNRSIAEVYQLRSVPTKSRAKALNPRDTLLAHYRWFSIVEWS